MTPGLWIALAAVVAALGFGSYRALTDGRFRGTKRVRATSAGRSDRRESTAAELDQTAATTPPATTWDLLAPAVAGHTPGERATLVQFSSAFCAPCRTTRRVLSDVADLVPGVVHLDIDAEQHLDVVRRLDVLRTPTTLVLDAVGNEVTRASGAPRKEQVLSAIQDVDPV